MNSAIREIAKIVQKIRNVEITRLWGSDLELSKWKLKIDIKFNFYQGDKENLSGWWGLQQEKKGTIFERQNTWVYVWTLKDPDKEPGY